MTKAALALSVLVALTPATAYSKCGTGNAPSYDDVTAIRFERDECKVPIHSVKSDCVSYLAFISNWNHRQKETREYEQFAPASAAGDYTLRVNASDVIGILKQYKFFELNPASIGISDSPYSVLTVKRCSVVTRVSQPAKYVNLNGFELDQPTQALFDALDAFIEKAPKVKVSGKPLYHETIWDGWF